MAITARSKYALAPSTLRSMVSSCASFQKLVKAATPTDALNSIVLSSATGEPSRPFALVGYGTEGAAFDRTTTGGLDYYLMPASLMLAFEIPTTFSGTATAGATRTAVTLAALAGMADDFLNGWVATCAGETATVQDFTGLTGVLTLAGTGFATAPGTGATVTLACANLSDEMTAMRNTVGDIMAELLAQSGASAGKSIGAARLQMEGRPPHDQEADDYWGCVWLLDWTGRP